MLDLLVGQQRIVTQETQEVSVPQNELFVLFGSENFASASLLTGDAFRASRHPRTSDAGVHVGGHVPDGLSDLEDVHDVAFF